MMKSVSIRQANCDVQFRLMRFIIHRRMAISKIYCTLQICIGIGLSGIPITAHMRVNLCTTYPMKMAVARL